MIFSQIQSKIQISGIPYTIEQLIGEGSFGKIYRATYNNINYAIKIQNLTIDTEVEFFQFLLNDGKSSKNLVQVFAIEKQKDAILVVMEYCNGCLYDELLQKKFEKENLRYVMKQIANGIYEMHSKNYAHRDLKPENILITNIIDKRFPSNNSQKIYKICDFGTIKNSDKLQTKCCGTPYYMAPELIQPQVEKYTNKCDIWSFGALIFEMLTGEILFKGKTVYEVQSKIVACQDEWVKHQIEGLKIESEYKELLINMLKVDPNQRLSIDQVLKKLEPKSRSVSRDRNTQQVTENRKILETHNNSFIRNPIPKPNSQFQSKNVQFF